MLRAPQARHEASLAQLLLVAGFPSSSGPTLLDGVASSFELPQDDLLAELSPITAALTRSEAQLGQGPIEVALRLLWEITTSKIWNIA